MRPLLLFGVLYVVFTQVVRLGGDVELYPVALLLGIVLFTFFSEATGGALGSLVDRESLIRKVEFPRLAVPLAAVLTALFNVALNLIVGGRLPARRPAASVRLSWLELPFLVAALALFATGLGDAALGAVRAATATSSRSGTSCCRCSSTRSPIFYPIDVVHRAHRSSPRS